MQMTLWEKEKSKAKDEYNPELSQWMTPSWAAEKIIEHALTDLKEGDIVIEPSCGTGNFLIHLPENVHGIGIEIDPKLARIAMERTGKTIIQGDFRTAVLPVDRCDYIIGNPPFKLDIFDGFLDKAHDLLDYGGPVIMLLPAFAFQTSSRVVRYNQRWTLSQEMLPRTLFQNIRLPLMLAKFIKDKNPKLYGLIFYHDSREIEEMPDIYRKALETGKSGWKAVVEEALKRLGGQGTVEQICAEIAPKRPTTTEHWRAKVRQQLGRHFIRKNYGTYSLAA